MPSHCSVPGCRMSHKVSTVIGLGVSFFQYPSDPNLRQLWIKSCKPPKMDLKYAKVCSQHFRAEDFERNLRAELLNVKERPILKKDAVPSQKLPDKANNKCAVSGCATSFKDAKKHSTKICFFQFPEQPDVRKEWVEKCNRSDSLNVETGRICSRHFKEEDFVTDLNSVKKFKQMLKENAIPSLLLECTSNSESTEESLQNENYPPEPEEQVENLNPVSSNCNSWQKGSNKRKSIDELQKPGKTKTARTESVNNGVVIKDEQENITQPTLNAYLINNNNQLQLVLGQITQPLQNVQIPKNVTTGTPHLKENVSLTFESISTICRICLSKPGIVSLENTKYEDLNYFDLLEGVAGAKIKRENPTSICNTCEQDLLKSYQFKKQIQNSEHALADFKVEIELAKMHGEITDKNQQDHDYAFSTAESPTIKIDRKNSQNILDDASNQPLILLQDPPPLFYLCNSADLQSTEENQLNTEDLPETDKQQEINESTTFETPKIKNKRKRVKSSSGESRISQTTRKRYIRQAYKLISTGYIEEGRKLIIDNNIMFPPRLVIALNPSKCKTCGIHLENEYDYKIHSRQTKHYRNPFPCDHCDAIFPTRQHLWMHKNGEVKSSRLCEKCGASFSSNKGLMQHVKKTHREEKYKCRLCGVCYPNLSHLARHRWRSHRDEWKNRPKMQVCEFCGLRLSSKVALRNHRDGIHLKVLAYGCTLCDAKFVSAVLLRKHQSVHRAETYECGFCNAVMKDRKKFINHRLKWHTVLPVDADISSEFATSDCTFCEYKSPNKQSLSIHLKEHKLDVCALCDDFFEDSSELIEHHRKQHDGIPEWFCRYCNRIYYESDALVTHLSVHKSKDFKCEMCPKVYDSANKLKRHKLIHDGVKNHTCQFCTKSFSHQSTLVVHERIHTGERPYKCDTCGSNHICASSLRKHQRRTHCEIRNEDFEPEVVTTEAQ